MLHPRYTLDELETMLPRMSVGDRFRIYGHRCEWTLVRTTRLFYVLASNLDRQMNILNENVKSSELVKRPDFFDKATHEKEPIN